MSTRTKHHLVHALKQSHQPQGIDLVLLTDPINPKANLCQSTVRFADLPLVWCSRNGHVGIAGRMSQIWKDGAEPCLETLACVASPYEGQGNALEIQGSATLYSCDREQVEALIDRFRDSFDLARLRDLQKVGTYSTVLYAWLVIDVGSKLTAHRAFSRHETSVLTYSTVSSSLCFGGRLIELPTKSGVAQSKPQPVHCSSKLIRWIKQKNNGAEHRKFFHQTGYALFRPAPSQLDQPLSYFDSESCALGDLPIAIVSHNGSVGIGGLLNEVLTKPLTEMIPIAHHAFVTEQPGVQIDGEASKYECDQRAVERLIKQHKDCLDWSALGLDRSRERLAVIVGAIVVAAEANLTVGSTTWTAAPHRRVVAANLLELRQ